MTGAASGSGRACAVALARAGARVVVNHRPESAAAGARVCREIADVGDEAQVAAMFSAASRGGEHLLMPSLAQAFATHGNCVSALACHLSDYTTGTTVSVDGGMSTRPALRGHG